MELRDPENSTIDNAQPPTTTHEGRNIWVLTAYGISGLALFGVLCYYFSSYITQ